MEVVEDSMDMSPTFSTPQMRMKPMWMWFHTTVNDVILFESWTVTTPRAMVWSCFVVITMGVLLEFVRYTRWRFEVNFKNDVQLNTNYMTRLFSLPHVVQTVLFGVQMVLAYFLMLIFMTFSVWLGIAVCVGAGLGFLLFGSRQRKRSFVESLDQNTGRCC
ncbi:hypothetical protein V3C99_004227 [Haemonchus contortus]